MKFFLPDWDDRVDPGYDFLTDRATLGRDPYADDVYAHELIGSHIYDGILVSRMALARTGRKRELVEKRGMRAYLRLPKGVELMGDCGAYGYINLKRPPFETAELVDYYERLGFDYGVSIDHVVVPEFYEERKRRYELTLENAGSFLLGVRRSHHRFTPVGAVQGWDVPSYTRASVAVVSMGYRYIGIGGLARRNTIFVQDVIQSIRHAVPSNVQIHLFGVGRLSLLSLCNRLGIASVDSATPIRQAWLSARDNYYFGGRTYAAIRIPMASEERAKDFSLVGRSAKPLSRLMQAEVRALDAIRKFDQRRIGLNPALESIISYDKMLAERLDGQSLTRRTQLYQETLGDRPWAHCKCPVCKEIGVDVIIFRGNNRNRRRGFHNLWTLRQRLKRVLGRAGVRPTDNSRQRDNRTP